MHNVQTIPGTRTIITVDIHQVGSSCGFSVPFYDFKDFRPTLNDFFANKERKFKSGKSQESMDRWAPSACLSHAFTSAEPYCRYWAYKNSWSMDGLPGMRRALVAGKRENVKPIKKMVNYFPSSSSDKPYDNKYDINTQVGPLAHTRYSYVLGFTVSRLVLTALVSFAMGVLISFYGRLIVTRGNNLVTAKYRI